ncbi:MAG: hypothetical protein OXG34_11745 [bacterium]|nr:hypothetical protein [bacterium]
MPDSDNLSSQQGIIPHSLYSLGTNLEQKGSGDKNQGDRPKGGCSSCQSCAVDRLRPTAAAALGISALGCRRGTVERPATVGYLDGMKLIPNLTKTLNPNTCGKIEWTTRLNKKSPSQPSNAAGLVFVLVATWPLWVVSGYMDHSIYIAGVVMVPSYFLLKFAFCRWLQHKDRQTV